MSAVEEGQLGCWPWLGALSRPDGRALLHNPDLGRPTQAARIAWQLSHHPMPDGLVVLHLCDHPWCVRPTYLVLGSQAANMAYRQRKQRTRGFHRRQPEQPDATGYRAAVQLRARHRRLPAPPASSWCCSNGVARPRARLVGAGGRFDCDPHLPL